MYFNLVIYLYILTTQLLSYNSKIYLRRADSTPTGNSRLCCCHFKDKLKENGPSIFAWNKNAIMDFRSPEKIKRYFDIFVVCGLLHTCRLPRIFLHVICAVVYHKHAW